MIQKIPSDNTRYLLLAGIVSFAFVLLASVCALGKLSNYIAYFPAAGGATAADTKKSVVGCFLPRHILCTLGGIRGECLDFILAFVLWMLAALHLSGLSRRGRKAWIST